MSIPTVPSGVKNKVTDCAKPDNGYVTVPVAAKLCGVPVRTVQWWAAHRKIKVIERAKRRVLLEDVKRLAGHG